MREDSPPPFIVFRTPARTVDVYGKALELVGQLHRMLERASARFHLKDRLDRAATGLVFEIARGRDEVRQFRWRHYRKAHRLVSDIATILDILAHQQAAPSQDLDSSRTLVRELLAELAALG